MQPPLAYSISWDLLGTEHHRKKAHIVQPTVKYPGSETSQDERGLGTEQKEAICHTALPKLKN